jgi:serine/threonine protein kinase/Ca2+-binding EF-hand superfamily protein
LWNKNTSVALKFFGYTDREPNEKQIYEEIDLLQTLRGIDGIVQLLATFMDPPRGMVSGKYFKKSYPCIVMEMLEGGEVFEKIEASGAISESDLALMFRGIVLALDSIHKRRYIHRDVKLENLMFVNNSPHSPVKIIDFGMMVRLKKGKTLYRSPTIQGTAGYVAPESLTYAVYSAASDIWQAGVCLYSMLSGFAPFHPKHPEQITEHSYFPMVGLGWDGISDSAKDLVAKILVKYPDDRITAAEILQHPWVTTEKAPRSLLGSDYSLRIKHLGIRQKMKTFFVENDIKEHRLRRDNLKRLLPALQDQQMSDFIISQSDDDSFYLDSMRLDRSCSIDSSHSTCSGDFSGKVKTLKSVVMNKIVDRSDSKDFSSDSPLGSSESPMPPSPVGSPPSIPLIPNLLDLSFDFGDHSSLNCSFGGGGEGAGGGCNTWEIDYLTFVNVMCESGLADLANPQVFGIFDSKGTGIINCKDFLLTMLAFIPEEDSASSETDEGSCPARLFFNLFDINDCGYIGMDELTLVVGCLMQDDTLPLPSEWLSQSDNGCESSAVSSRNIKDLFDSIDTNRDGRIDFEEFRSFYEAVLTNSLTRRSRSCLRPKESPRPGSPSVGLGSFSPRSENDV